MGAYLTDHPPLRKGGQWYDKRNRPLTGCTALHTAESVMDTLGPDTGAENVAEFIRTRSDPGSYHDLVDADSWIPLVDLKHAAFHDGTGSNNWALSLSFACRTTDWARMTPEKRRGFLHQGARAFANQQLYRRHVGAPLTRLRLISKAQSDRGESGFIYHGLRDPGRRTDPGVKAPHLFPLDEFLAECRAELARVMPDHPDAGGAAPARPATTREWDEMASKDEIKDAMREVILGAQVIDPLADHMWRHPLPEGHGVPILHLLSISAGVNALLGRPGVDVDEAQIAATLAPMLTAQITRLSAEGLADVAKAVADEQSRRMAA